MDYEKKYKEALEKAKSFNKRWQCVGATNSELALKELKEIFPELKESEDEKIRKALVRFHKSTIDIDGIKGADILAWLEKQGDNNNQNWKPSKEQINALEHFVRSIGESGYTSPYDDNTNLLNSLINDLYKLEKQGEQKPTVVDFNAKDWYVSKVDGKIHDLTYNPADNVEPKFKVGDFIVNDYCMGRVIEITNDAYLLDIGQGIPFSCENNVHLWTIKDAKDGDVLASDNSIFIFQEEYIAEKSVAYCGLMNGLLVKGENACWTNEKCHPATKEQRDLLFTKMKEAGYEWDAEKKELKKIDEDGVEYKNI